MANVIKTVLTYQLDGSTRDFNIPFEYLARKFVVVTLIGVDRKVLTLNTDYRFATRTTISLTKAWGYADGYTTIELRRVTSTTDRLVDFTDGSILRAYDLNVAQIQTMHVAEEARDLTSDTIGVNNDGNLDARGRRIVNVGDGVAPGDAVTIGQMDRWTGSASNSAGRAKVSETNAKVSETNAKVSENNAKTSEINSKASETLAEKWASNPEDTLVSDTHYSALHYARKASASASSSSLSASAASKSASDALTSANDAAEHADVAQTEAGKLAQFNDIVDRMNSVAVAQVGSFEVHNSRTYAKPGTVYADGQLLNRNQFPTLVEELLAGHLPVVSDEVWLSDPSKRGCYTLGNGTTNFRVPDLNGVYTGSIKAPVLRGDGGLTIGDVQASGVPNAKGLIEGNSILGRVNPDNTQGIINTSPTNPLNVRRGSYANEYGQSNAHTDYGSALDLDLSRAHKVYRNGLDEVRVNSVVIVWVVRTHGVVNNPGSVDAAVLASRVEQVYTELLTRMVANENREKSGQKFLRRVFDYSTYGSPLGLGKTVTLSEDVTNKMLVIGSFPPHTTPSATVPLYRCSPFLRTNTGDRMYINMGSWRYTLEFTSANQITMVDATGADVQAISYIDVVCDYPQT